MAQRLSKLGSRIALLLLIAVVATGCGRRGPLEAPSNASIVSVDEEGEEQTQEVKEDKPFFLDGLL